MNSLPVGCSSFAFVMFTAPIVYCALLPTTRHLDRAAAAATQWLGAGEGRRELLASFCRQPDVCARCVLCLSGAKAPACFEIPERDLAAVLGSVLGLGAASPTADPAGPMPTSPLTRAGRCAVCLGIVSEASAELAASLAAQVWQDGFARESVVLFMLSLSVPSSVIIRQHLYCAKVRSELKAAGTAHAALALQGWKPLQMKEAFQFAIAPSLSSLLGGARQEQTAAADGQGRLRLEVDFRHDESAVMKQVLLVEGNYKKSVRGKAPRGERRGQMQDVENSNAVLAALSRIPDHELLEKFPFPPAVAAAAPSRCVRVERDTVFVGGNYCKFSRQVSQSPWNAAHGSVGDSVQTLILHELGPLFKADEAKFVGSGREDLDVRMLGEGRPFFIEFINSKTLPVSPHLSLAGEGGAVAAGGRGDEGEGAGGRGGRAERVTAGQPEVWAGIQDRVNASTDCIAVRQLRPVPRSYADAIKGASESKRKTYRALVWTSAAARAEDIARVNTLTPLVLQQKTPVRVLHRRSLATRARTVTFMQVRNHKSVAFVFVVCVWRFTTHCGCACGSSGPVGHFDDVAVAAHQRVLAPGSHAPRPASFFPDIWSWCVLQLERVNERFYLLDLETEAGTYVKEFVHGDMGRTQPSLAGLLQCDAADILQLDVVSVQQ